MIEEDTKKLYKKFKKEKELEILEKHDKNLYGPHGTGVDNGRYELVSALTHKGRSANSGHYISYAHNCGSKYFYFFVKHLKIIG